MAYYQPYQSQYYTQMQVPQMVNPPVQQPPQAAQSSLIWVQGEAGAKSYMVAPNVTVMLMDSEAQRFYLKSSDASGMPLPLRVFEYTETTAKPAREQAPAEQKVDLSTYATKAELDAFREEITGLLKNVPRQTTRRSEKREAEDDE
ncbi:MAG: hypothetical protein J6Y48_15655 [Clostridia bacterium]|nr:hypothetical protein [Oscillospiraceae bacterium]MBP5728506.1 hypothetical protein [Clostridia bacterium]